MTAALAADSPESLEPMDTVCRRCRGRTWRRLTAPVVAALVDEVVTVPEGAVCTEMLDLYATEGIIAEPAGALATTAVRQLAVRGWRPDGAVICIVLGDNNDVSRRAVSAP